MFLNTVDTTRIPGQDAVELGVNTSRFAFPSIHVPWRPNMAVLAPAEECLSAMVAASLVHHPHNGLLLLTPRSHLAPAVGAELSRLELTGRDRHGQPLRAQVFLVGNFSPAVVNQVLELGYSVFTVADSDPAELARQVAMLRQALNRELGKRTNDVMVISMDDCRGGLAAPGFSAHAGIPILLTREGQVPAPTADALRGLGNPNVHIVQPNRPAADQVSSALKALTDGQVVLIGGESPVETAINFARYQSADGEVGWGRNRPGGHAFSFAPQHRWYAAVLAGLLSHIGKHAPVLLVPAGKSLPQVLHDYLLSVNPEMTEPPGPPFMHGFIMGDTAGISWEQQILLEEALIQEARDSMGHGM